MSEHIPVNLPADAYDVLVETGLLRTIGSHVRAAAKGRRCLLAVDSTITNSHGTVAAGSLREAGYETMTTEVVAEEKRKSLNTVRRLYTAMLEHHLDRTCPVVALGGGITGDTAGFAAATYLRGVPLIHVPTTLLAMVDAAIGGKTGVNIELPGRGSDQPMLGKNLIGAFWQPKIVLVDPETLHTLDPRHFRCGLAECVKHALIADAPLFDFLQDNANAILSQKPDVLTEVILRSARIKAEIVAGDERESGRRALLNLGHTFAHAIEAQSHLHLHHGEAVAIGLVAAAHAACQTRRLGQDQSQRITRLLKQLKLPIELPLKVEPATLTRAMAYDKKIIAGQRRLILPNGLGRAEIVTDVPDEVIENVWRSVGAG